MKKITYAARKAAITVFGLLLLLIGAILLVLPGPGLLVIILGLIVLSWEYEWAKMHLQKAKDIQKKVLEKARGKRDSKNT